MARDKGNAMTDLELFRDLINKSDDSILLADYETSLFIFVNDKACETLGYERRELLKMRVTDIQTALPDDFSWQAHANAVRREGSLMFEGIHKRKNGTTFPIEASVSHVELEGKEYLVGVVRDITERKRAEEALQESEARFHTIFDQAIDGILMADIETKKFIEANSAICEMLGYSHKEVLKIGVPDIHPETDLADVVKVFERQMRGEISLASDIPVLKKDGSVFYADINAATITLNGKHCLIGIFRDITERKKTEREREQYFKLFQNSNDLMVIADPDGTFKRVNPACLRKLGYSEEELISRPFIELVHPDDKQSTRDEMERQRQRGFSLNFENRYICKDGSIIWLSWRASYNEADGLTYATARDITRRKDAESKMRQSEEFIRSILNTVDEGFIVIDPGFRIVTANKAYCDQVGGCDETTVGRHCYELSHGASRPCYEEGEECVVRLVLEDGQPHTATHRHVDSSGGLLFVETKGYPIKDASGNITSVIETINNITEKHLLEEERLKIQKLESIGTLAGGIAHDFNNLLQGVFGYISMAKMFLDQREKSLPMLEQAENALQQSVSLTTQLLTFSKGGRPVKKRISLPAVIENAAKFALSGARSSYRLDVESSLWEVDADGGQLGQVIQNVVLNADQAMPEGGTVFINARNSLKPDKEHPHIRKGRYVEISVQDSGIGIPGKYLQKIFDPYFTTKEKGSGLGLATSYSIIRNHGGTIDVASEPGKGTTFFIYLPACDAREEFSEAVPASLSDVRKKVLVMDDEEVVRTIAGQFLRSMNHEARLAGDGETALREYMGAKADGHPFDVVILDLTVRDGMGGKETIQRLLEIDPGVRAIVSSGYSDDAVVADYKKYGFMARLTKPYKLDDLRDTLNAVFSA